MYEPVAGIGASRYYFASGEAVFFRDTVVTEYDLSLEVSSQIAAAATEKVTFNCTPEHLDYLILGWLCTNGLISDIDDVREMMIDVGDNRAEVILSEQSGSRKPTYKSVPFFNEGYGMSQVHAVITEFSHYNELFQKTGAVHEGMIYACGKVQYRAQDIGRFNAADKVIGMALADRMDFSSCLLFTSGRMPVEMIEKVATAGIPTVVSRSAPTMQAVSAAKKRGIGLLGFAGLDHVNIYT